VLDPELSDTQRIFPHKIRGGILMEWAHFEVEPQAPAEGVVPFVRHTTADGQGGGSMS